MFYSAQKMASCLADKTLINMIYWHNSFFHASQKAKTACYYASKQQQTNTSSHKMHTCSYIYIIFICMHGWASIICRHVVGVCILCACMCITTCMGVVFCCCFFSLFFFLGGGGGPNVHKLKETTCKEVSWPEKVQNAQIFPTADSIVDIDLLM